ncbi:MAG: hypothetical protein KKC03_13720 [Bacteroidetes bacterium]|nr:hypothetical protein [Bacteroidota bacterium]
MEDDPHDNIPMIWRINQGAFAGTANGAIKRDSKFKYVTIFLDNILIYSKEFSPETLYRVFIRSLLRVIHHEYVHHYIPIEYIGHEKTKVDPMAKIMTDFLLQDFDEWTSWWGLFYDCLEWLRVQSSNKKVTE